MKTIFYCAIFLFFSKAFAYDCSAVAPFIPSGQQAVKVTVAKFKWDQGNPIYEDVCSESVTIDWFDVQGREEEAYYCLKPKLNEVAICKTTLGNEIAEVDVIPASWIRTGEHNPVREYRFHAYVVKENDPQFYYDIFSRSLLPDLSSQDLILEGSLRTGPSNPDDGFWIRAEFSK